MIKKTISYKDWKREEEEEKKKKNTVGSTGPKSLADSALSLWAQKSPIAAQKLKELAAYRKAGNTGLSADAIKQLQSTSFFMPETVKDYNHYVSGQAYRDQLGLTRLHRNEGIWDVAGNSPSVMSDSFLKKQLAETTAKLGVTQAIDKVNSLNSKKQQDAYDKARANSDRWGQLYKEREQGYNLTDYTKLSKDDPKYYEEKRKAETERAKQWDNWLMAEYLLGDQTTDWQDFYNQRNDYYDTLSDEEYYKEEDRLDKQFRGLDWQKLMNPAAPAYQQSAEDVKKLTNLRDLLQKEQTNREGWQAFADEAEGIISPAMKGLYQRNIDGYDPEVYNPQYAAFLPYFINHAAGGQQANLMEMLSDNIVEDLASMVGVTLDYDAKAVQGYYNKGYDYLLPEEIEAYNRLYSADPARAQEMLDFLEPQLLERRAIYNAEETVLMAQNPVLGTLMSGASILSQPYGAVQSIYGAVTGEGADSAMHDITSANQVTRQTVGEEWGKALPFKIFGEEAGTTVYNVLMSMGDMLMANTIGGAAGKAGAAAGATNAANIARNTMQTVMSSEVMAGTIYNDMQQGYTNEQAVLHGLTNGVIEAWMERGFMDELFSGKSFTARNIGSMLAEGGEEIGTDILQTVSGEFAAFLTGREGEIQQVYEQYKDTLPYGEDPGAATLMHYANQFALSGLSGMAMGGGVAAVTGTGEYLNTSATGADVKNQGAAEAILSIAEGMQDGSQAKQTAEKIREKQGKNKKVSNYQLGQVTQQLATELDEENSRIVDQVMDDAITDRLVELGEDKATAQKNASAIRKLSRGQKLTMDERMAVKWSDNATQVVKELSRETAAKDGGQQGAAANAPNQQATAPVQGNEAEGQRTGQKWVTAMQKTADGATAGVASKQLMMNAARSGLTVSESANEAVKNAADKVKVTKSGKVSGKTTSAAVNFTDNGVVTEGELVRFEKKNGQMKAMVTANEITKEIPLEELTQYEGSGVAAIAQYIQENDGGSRLHDMTTQEANAMLNTYQAVGGDARTFIDAFEETYLAGYAGVEAPTFAVNPRIRDIAYAEGQREAQLDEEARKERAGTYRAVEAPQTGWLGKVTNDSQLTGGGDTAALTVAMEGMTESQRATAEAAMAIGNAAGMNVVLYESDLSNGSVANGKFSRSSHTIYLDVNAGAATAQGVQAAKNEGSLGFAIIRTMGHELTHYLEAASPEMYGKYKQAVREALKANQQDMAVLIREKLDRALNSGHKLTYAGAEAEVIADASEYMLEQSTFVEKMEPSLKARVKSWVQGFMEKIRTAFSNLVGGHKESAALRRVVDGVNQYTGKLQELWDASLMEAAQQGTETADQSGEATVMVEDMPATDQFKLRDTVEKRKDGLLAMHNLKLEDVWGIIKLGGFPMPSIAIVKAKHGHTMYGPYSVIFGQKTIDPEADYRNRVYGADAWTPVFPAVETELLGDEMYKTQEAIRDLAGRIDDEFRTRANAFFGYFSGDDATTKTMQDMLDIAWNNYGLLGAYLADQGETVDVLETDVEVNRGYNPKRADMYDKILDMIDVYDLVSMKKHELLDNYGDRLAEEIKVPFARMNANWKAGDRQAGARMIEIINQAIAYEGSGRDTTAQYTKKKDYYATQDAMRNKIDRTAFDAWMQGKIQNFMGQQGIYNGKERFTPMGNRKTFKQTHMPLTAENVVKAMASQQESNIPATDAHGLMAAAATRYGSVDEIRADSARLGKISDEEYRARLAGADNDLRDFLNSIEAWDYDQQEVVGDLLVQAAKGKMTAARIKTLFNRHGYVISAEASKMADRLLKNVQSIPTGYFEAKPSRVVNFDEVRMLVAPQDMPSELAEKLDELGIPYTTYDGTDADRIAKANEVEDAQFSLRDEPDAVSIREYLGSMQVTSRMTETEKILLKRYQENLKALAEKEQQAAEQDAILRTATGDELIKAKNRYQIYRTQANRLNRALLVAERDEGFARLMATSQRVVNDYLLGSSGAVADAADALETEIADLSKRLKSLEAEVTRTSSGQRTAFARGLFDQKMLNAAAEGLKNSYGSRMSVKAIADRMALAYGELYAGEGAEGARNFSAAAKDLATDLLRGNKFRYKSEILPLLTEKIGSISLTETDRQEIRNAGISVTEYRRMLSPYIKVVEGGSDLASYASSAQYYGEGTMAAILADDVEGNLAMQLYNVISEEKAREADISFEGMSEAELIGMAMADIAGANLPVNTAGSATTYLRNELMKYAGESAAVAQAIDEAVSRAEIATQRAGSVWREAARDAQTARQAVEYYRKLDETRRLMELQEQKQAITEELKSDNAKKLTEKVQKYREEYRAREQKAREYRYARQDLEKLRRGVGRKVKRLNTLRMRETDQKHVPEELKRIADTVMQTFTDTSLSKLAFAPAKTASLARQYRALKEVESDASHYWDDEVEAELDNLQALGEAYTALREREGGMPSSVSLEGVQLENEIMKGVDNIVSNVLQMIDSENDAFLKGRTETFEQFANKAGNALLQHKDYKQFRGMLGQGQKFVDEMLRKGNMTPIYFFEHLRNPEMKDVFDEIRRGQSHYAQIVAEGKAYVQEMKNKYHYGAWAGDGVLKMKTGQGHSIELTREEAAEIYAIAERERRNALYQTEHLLVGGFQYKDVKNKGDGKTQIKNEPNKLNAADLEKIRNWLTEDQKAYADALVSFLSNQMAEYGNEASMAMYGYRKFTEKYYIPFHTVSEQRFLRGDEGPQGEDAGTGRLKNSGFTNKLQYKANATLYIGGLTDTVADHIHKMASYAAMVEPIENMKRLMNHKVIGDDGTTNTIRALIGQKYGQASQDYMTQLLKDLNGSTQSDNRASGFTDKLIGAFKRGAVLASASVVLQQPTAAARAMAYISPKYFAQNPFYRPGKGTWDELTKYSGTAVIKDMGKFDVGLGMTARQYIADEHLAPWEAYRRLKAESKTEAGKAAYQRAVDWLTAAPGMADQWTWGLIWKAVKAEQTALNPRMDHNSEEFLQLCGERFDDVIDHTQVYDSVLTRSNLMRSTNALHKMATSFMSEPTLSINMLYDALAGNHSKGKRAAIIGGVITSQVLAGALAALAQAWNDDEDKRNWAERYTERAVSNVVDNLNPLGMIPYVSDIMSMFAGYEVERPDMSVIKDIMDYTSTFFDKMADPDKQLTWKDYENFIGTLANLTGLPAKNISREMRRTWNMVVNSQWTTPNATNLQFVALESTGLYGGKNTEYYERMVNAYLRGDEERAEDYRTYMLTSKMVAEDKLQTGLKTAMKEAYIAGDTDEDTAIQYLLKIGSYAEEDDAYWEVDKWQYMRETGSTADSYRKYADFFQAVETGANLKATIQVYLDNGVSKTTLASQITNQYKKQLIALKQSGKGYADLQARILTAYEALGYDRAKKLKDIQKWFE